MTEKIVIRKWKQKKKKDLIFGNTYTPVSRQKSGVYVSPWINLPNFICKLDLFFSFTLEMKHIPEMGHF